MKGIALFRCSESPASRGCNGDLITWVDLRLRTTRQNIHPSIRTLHLGGAAGSWLPAIQTERWHHP